MMTPPGLSPGFAICAARNRATSPVPIPFDFFLALAGQTAQLHLLEESRVKARFALLLFSLTPCAVAARAQSTPDWGPQHGDHEIEIWSGAGHSGDGGIPNTGLWSVGLRYGWILTDPMGPGLLRGRFEFQLDAAPIYLFFQPSGRVYGSGINPVGLKWNFQTRGRVAPYVDIESGVLFTSRGVPAGISHVNFVSGPGFGVNVEHGKLHWSAELRLTHISDAGLTLRNPGTNIVQLRMGLGRFGRRRG
jgi:lipid A 3-O-deacylase